ncbi:phage integrase family protein [Cryptosporangium arvum DSM 44712]|uniref:Phage integrase family protein n=1 Tax=Cryptosporangium arvum DSM 44712 TaxID=927661 RepID=A0A010YG78_9ACTN|nr:phage integrase family protein [Cryptosporangium arvum DSM 44712]
MLTGNQTEFVMLLTIAYTGMRWSEALAIAPGAVRKEELDIHWKLYELGGRFYRGYPKDGSKRTVDIPPFLRQLLANYLGQGRKLRCPCVEREGDDRDDIPWCHGDEYVFLGARGGHHQRSHFSERIMRPAADGWYTGRSNRPRMPVLVDLNQPYPGAILPPWPANDPAAPPHVPQRRRGLRQPPADAALASWLPVLNGLTPHGLRHGHKTWMDEAKIHRSLSTDRMGHEVPGMDGIYGHITPGMRRELLSVLEDLWTTALQQRAAISRSSAVPMLDALLKNSAAPNSLPETEKPDL